MHTAEAMTTPRKKRPLPPALELNLKGVRELRGKLQVEIAPMMGMDQSELSKSERRPDRLVSTLRRYIEALGGKLEIVARFGKTTVRLKEV